MEETARLERANSRVAAYRVSHLRQVSICMVGTGGIEPPYSEPQSDVIAIIRRTPYAQDTFLTPA